MTNTQQLRMDIPDSREIQQTVEDYQFEPIKGYPMLHWKGKRPFNSTQYYPAQRKEVHGEETNGWLNKIYWGDNLQVMSHLLKEYRGKVSLCYIDPPFDSKAEYKKKINLRGQQVINDQSTFEEKQYTDIWTNDEYLQFMYERLIFIRELLTSDGNIFVHCDSKKSHQLRCILDEIFGEDNFINEIIWHYRKWSTKIKAFQKNHDNIIWYSKNKNNSERIFKVVDYEAPSEGTLRRWKGKKQRADFDESGKRTATELEEESSGSPLSDVWYEQDLEDVQKISIINPAALERTNYPTQKPEELLRRIIEATTNVDDVVFDCFMGSGTTQAVAMKLGRKFIGADINLGAVQTTSKRLLEIRQEFETQQQGQLEVKEEESNTYYTGFEVYNVNHYDIFRNPAQAKELLIEALEINPIEKNSLFDGEKNGRMIKIMPVNRIATRADLSELITGFDYKAFKKKSEEYPNKFVEKITLVCMGHEPDLAAQLQREVKPFLIEVEVVDILRDKSNLEFKRDSEADIVPEKGFLIIKKFYPMNLLQKLSIQQENVEDWRKMVESVMIDWNYDGAVLEPQTVDIPGKDELVKGKYKIPDDAGTIKVKITDLLSESLEVEVQHG